MFFMYNGFLFQNHIDLKIKDCWELLLLFADAIYEKPERFKYLWVLIDILYEKIDWWLAGYLF